MLKKLSAIEFNEIVSASIYTNLEYMEVTAKVMKAKAVYFVFFRNDLPQVAFALFEKSKKIVLPEFYPIYSGVWLNGTLENLNLRNDLIQSIVELKLKYKSIKICLSPDIQDIRAFIWNGFDVKLKYTYVKNLTDLSYKSDVLKNYKLAKKDFKFDKEALLDDNWILFKRQLFEIGFSQRKLNQLHSWFIELSANNVIKVFSVRYLDGKLGGIGIVLLDQQKLQSGFLLSYGLKNEKQSEINSMLYVSIHKWLSENGFNQFDFFGANTRSIADYKSRFNPELKSYFVVEFSRVSFNNLLSKILR